MKRAVRLLVAVITAMLMLVSSMLLLVSSPALASNDELIIQGSGFGHGVGMSQYGSYARALAGQDYKEILAAYYKDTSVGVIGQGGIPTLDNVMTSVKSDDRNVTITIVDGPGSGGSSVRVTRSTGELDDLTPGDTLTIVDCPTKSEIVDPGDPDCPTDLTGLDAGVCIAGLVVSRVDMNWGAGSCDFTIALAVSGALPDNLVQLDECRTANCTFGWGETLHIVDNGSALRDDRDRVCPDESCPLYAGFDLVVEATLDDYTRGVAESVFSWGNTDAGKHALYTQAVAARSYAASFVTSIDHKDKPCFCVLVNSSSAQVYAGWLGNRTSWENWDKAAVATAGEVVVVAPSKIVRAYYSSSNGGASENNEDIWSGSPVAWLRSVPDSWSTSAASGNPNRAWTKTTTTAVLESKLNLTNVYDIRIAATYTSGTPSRIVVTGERGGKTVEVDDYPLGSGTPMDGVLFDAWFGLKGPHITGFGGSLPEPPPVTDVDRWWGANRYDTAVEISKANFASADAVVIVTGLNYPDALAAASFAATIDAPILLVAGGTVPGATIREVQRLKPSKIYILGGTAAVPQSAENVLDDIAPVTRLAGSNRYGTAIQISRAAHAGPVDTVYLAPGTSFVEALVAGPVAASSGNAILLVPPTSLPGALVSEIQRLSPSKIVVIGGGSIVSHSVVDQLGAYAESVISISGSNRYATSVLVAEHGFPSGAETVLIVTGAVFPDALVGSRVAGHLNAPILIVELGSLPAVVAGELLRLDPLTVRVLGGPAAIADSVVQDVINLLG